MRLIKILLLALASLLTIASVGNAAPLLLGGFASFGGDQGEPASVELLLSGDDSAIGTPVSD